jgi:hypothetical protein
MQQQSKKNAIDRDVEAGVPLRSQLHHDSEVDIPTPKASSDRRWSDDEEYTELAVFSPLGNDRGLSILPTVKTLPSLRQVGRLEFNRGQHS